MQTDRFQRNVSAFDWNAAIDTVGNTLSNVFSKPDTYNTYNTTVTEEDNDNTALYVGIGGAVLLVVVLILFMKK